MVNCSLILIPTNQLATERSWKGPNAFTSKVLTRILTLMLRPACPSWVGQELFRGIHGANLLANPKKLKGQNHDKIAFNFPTSKDPRGSYSIGLSRHVVPGYYHRIGDHGSVHFFIVEIYSPCYLCPSA